MIDHWFEPQILEMFIYDLSNYLIFILILYIFYKKNYIGNKLFLISALFLLTPFLFNGFLFDWSYLPDQSKYLGLSDKIRKNYFGPTNLFFCDPKITLGLQSCENTSLKVGVSSLFYAYSPILNFESYKSIGFYNRFLFIISAIFFYKKKAINTFLFYLLLFSPSLILFSSVSLRDNLILLIMFFWIFYVYENKYFKAIFFSILILLIKIQNFLVFVFSILLIFLTSKKKLHQLSMIIVLILILSLSIYNFDEIIGSINKYREGLFIEEYGNYKSISSVIFYENIRLDFNLKSLILIINNALNFFISPLINLNSLFELIILSENIFLYSFLTYLFSKNYKSNKKVTLTWFLILLFSFIMYSIFIFNDAQIHRYKTPIIFFVIFAYNLNLKKKFIK